MSKKRPTGFVARCQCGVFVGAMDFERTDRTEAGKILGEWLFNGFIVEPRFAESWTETIESCKCTESEPSDG